MFRFTRYKRLMGERMPRGYRTAWYNYDMQFDACYPIGIHLIARWIHRIWEWTYLYNPSKLESLLIEAANKARRSERAYADAHLHRVVEQEQATRRMLELRLTEMVELAVKQQELRTTHSFTIEPQERP